MGSLEARHEARRAEANEIPYCARTGVLASTTDSATWSTFDEAVVADESSSGYDGIGFVFTVDGPYVGVDLDDCIDVNTGELTVEAQGIVALLDSYTEWTPSGKGLHINLLRVASSSCTCAATWRTPSSGQANAQKSRLFCAADRAPARTRL